MSNATGSKKAEDGETSSPVTGGASGQQLSSTEQQQPSPPQPQQPPQRRYLYTVELFGGLRLREMGGQGRVITRFRTQKTAALIAYLAYHRDRMHAREVLVERFWPEADTNGRMSLAVSLSALRSQLEPPSIEPRSVLIADRTHIGLNAEAITTDVAHFESLLDQSEGRRGSAGEIAPDRRAALLAEAIELYRPELLPGLYDDWITPQQERLTDRYRVALARLSRYQEEAGKLTEAIGYARLAVHSDPLTPATCAELLRLLTSAGDREGVSSEVQQFATRIAAAFDKDVAESALADLAAIAGPLPQSATILSSGADTPTTARRPSAPASRQSSPPVPNPAQTDPSSFATGPATPETPSAKTPPPSTAPSPLQIPLTKFFGRDADIQRLRRLAADPEARLITITGPGGIGKTRFALTFANTLLSEDSVRSGHEVFWVALAHLSEASLLPAALAEGVGADLRKASAAGSSGLLAAAAEALSAARNPILMLDNFEHLVEEGAPVVEELLLLVPELTCIVTSRQRLSLIGLERELPLGALPVPPMPKTAGADAVPHPQDLLRWYPSVALFVDRAQAAQPYFQITKKNAAAIAELVARLDGIPLAIELAAARTQVMTPQQMLAQLFQSPDSRKRFELLVNRNRSRVALERHRSLWSTLAWSYDLLAPELRRLFRALCAFRGSFDSATAEEVVAAAGLADPDLFVLDGLAQLCDASLLRPVEEDPGIAARSSAGTGDEDEDDIPVPQVRFAMLEMLRSFAEGQLREEDGEESWLALRKAHAEYYLTLTETADEQGRLSPPLEASLMERNDREGENLHAALRFLAEQSAAGSESSPEADGATALLARLSCSLSRYWQIRGRLVEGRHWLTTTLNRYGMAVAKPGSLSAATAPTDPNAEAARLPEKSLVFAGKALNKLAVFAMYQGDPAARQLLLQSLPIRERLGDVAGTASVLNNLAILASDAGDFDGAEQFYERALPLFQEMGQERYAGIVLSNLGNLASRRGDDDRYESLTLESLEIARKCGDGHAQALRLSSLCDLYERRGDLDLAEKHGKEGLQIAHEGRDIIATCHVLMNLATLAAVRGDTLHADRLLACGLSAYAAHGIRLADDFRRSLSVLRPDLFAKQESPLSVPVEALAATMQERLARTTGGDNETPPVAMTLDEAVAYVLHGA